MAKIRVGQLAKELNLKVGEVLARLRDLGAEVKSNLSTVDEEMAVRLRSAAPSPEKRPAEALKTASPAGSPAAGGRATLKSARPKDQPATPAATAAPATPKVTSTASHATPQAAAVRTPAVKATAAPVPAGVACAADAASHRIARPNRL